MPVKQFGSELGIYVFDLPETWDSRRQPAGVAVMKMLTRIRDRKLRDAISRTGVASPTELRTLILKRARVRTLKGIEQFRNLRKLDLSGNRIHDLSPLARLRELSGLFLTDNEIRKLSALKNLSRLPALDISGNRLTGLEGLSGMRSLTWLNASQNQIASAEPLRHCAMLSHLNLRNNLIASAEGLHELRLLRSLDLSQNELTGTITIPPTMQSLRHLLLSRNAITDVAMKQDVCWIEELDVSGNLITNLDFIRAMPELVVANLSENLFKEITPIQACKKVRILYLWMSGVVSVRGLEELTNLEELGLADNAIGDVSSLLGLNRLKLLYLGTNHDIPTEAIWKLSLQVEEDFRGPDWRARVPGTPERNDTE